MTARNHFVYCVYDADGVVIYVGKTQGPEQRWYAHTFTKPEMVAAAKTCRMAGPYGPEGARLREAHLIHTHSPAFNVYGKGHAVCPCGCEDEASGPRLPRRTIRRRQRATGQHRPVVRQKGRMGAKSVGNRIWQTMFDGELSNHFIHETDEEFALVASWPEVWA